MVRLGLNFICKNESHVILRMLESVAPITDIIVAVDTGSTDHTIALIQQFGQARHIPTYVFERPFDDFASSRNYALVKLTEVAIRLGWNLETSWGVCIDCDERMTITSDFRKETLSRDLYLLSGNDNGVLFTKESFLRLGKSLIWEGPIHECIKIKDGTTEIIKGLYIDYYREGASWKGNLADKFLNYAEKLIEYVEAGHKKVRWIYYIGESFCLAAENSQLPKDKKRYYAGALSYFEQARELATENIPLFYNIQLEIAKIKIELEDDPAEIIALLLQTYSLDPTTAEPLFGILLCYLKREQWEECYLFSSFCVKQFHARMPQKSFSFLLNSSIYHWQILNLHHLVSYHSHRRRESKHLYHILKTLILSRPPFYTTMIEMEIRAGSPFILSMLKYLRLFRKVKVNLNIKHIKMNKNPIELNIVPE